LIGPVQGGVLEGVRGVSLSALLEGVGDALAVAYRTGVWTVIEVSRVDARSGGHVYLEVAERDSAGSALAQARAMIWARTANKILPPFEQATGAVLGAGIKLLVRAKPTMHAVYGLSLDIDAIDPDFTLGDLAARKREIRARLKAEGLLDRNRQLPSPWDYNAVLVIAPQGAAGLGDFKAESERLDRLGICRFTYLSSRFQGEGAAEQVQLALHRGLADWRASNHRDPDAICIIRGGGAVNDLAWLNDYALARWICECDVPVLTGIGHERDETILDEVAHCAYDTPSKAILGIENVIRLRAGEVKAAFEDVVRASSLQLHRVRRDASQLDAAIRQGASGLLRLARFNSAQTFADVRVLSGQRLRHASEIVSRLRQGIEHDAAAAVVRARQGVLTVMSDTKVQVQRFLFHARSGSRQQWQSVVERSGAQVRSGRASSAQAIRSVSRDADRSLASARERSESLVREVTGQGPQKALQRGLAIIRAGGRVVTSARQLTQMSTAEAEVEFHDGRVSVSKPTGST
jgi:exodeoxyribonuclease VII large subunit